MRAQAGYCFVIFKNQILCQNFLSSCMTADNGRQYFSFFFWGKKHKVEVRPYKLVDAHYGHDLKQPDARYIFIGGIPRDTTAETLAMQLEARFGSVTGVKIDLHHETLYPNGTAVAVFGRQHSAEKAIHAQTLVLKKGHHPRRTIELKPFLDNKQICPTCHLVGPAVYCPCCNRVTCEPCWDDFHMFCADGRSHQKITRGTYYTVRRR
jgi:hypothetical protein